MRRMERATSSYIPHHGSRPLGEEPSGRGDEVGALAAGASSGFETDAGTPADQKNSLAEQLRFAEG
jgi:hypothetical protein